MQASFDRSLSTLFIRSCLGVWCGAHVDGLHASTGLWTDRGRARSRGHTLVLDAGGTVGRLTAGTGGRDTGTPRRRRLTADRARSAYTETDTSPHLRGALRIRS